MPSITDAATLANLLKHDSTYGTWHVPVYAGDNTISVNGQSILVPNGRDPATHHIVSKSVVHHQPPRPDAGSCTTRSVSSTAS